MNHYTSYMDRVALTPEEHAALMAALTRPAAQPKFRYVNHFAALAACCALVLAGAWGIGRLRAPESARSPVPPTSAPVAAVTAAPNAKVYDAPADPDTGHQANTDPNPAIQPPAVVLPHVETPAPTDVITEYTIPSPAPGEDVSSYPIQVDTAPRESGAADLTLDACRAEPVLGGHLPASIPRRFTFASGSSTGGALSALWTSGMEELHVSLTRPETPPDTMDPADPARYDVRLYAIPWCDSVPEDILFGGFQDPVFRQEDLTEALIAARGLSVSDSGDAAGLRFTFSVLYPDGVVARYSLKGLTAAEAAALVLE